LKKKIVDPIFSPTSFFPRSTLSVSFWTRVLWWGSICTSGFFFSFYDFRDAINHHRRAFKNTQHVLWAHGGGLFFFVSVIIR
jgi:hypothetical protein